jgi:hypothetical protein
MTTDKYQLKEITPKELRCIAGLGCPAIYETEEITPASMRCIVAGCSSVYELKRLTPKGLQCGASPCPEVYEQNKENYLIIGKVIDPKSFGLEHKVGKDEMLISISKAIVDGAVKKEVDRKV